MSQNTLKIVNCARDLYFEEGMRGWSMRKVAARVGITAPAIYRHFDNKDDLLSEIMIEGFRTFGKYIYRSLSGRTPDERLLLAGEGYLDFALERPKYYELLFMMPTQLWKDGLPERVERISRATYQFLADRVRECMDSGFLRQEDSRQVALTIWAHCHGIVSLYLSDRLDMDEDSFRRRYNESTSLLLIGLRQEKA